MAYQIDTPESKKRGPPVPNPCLSFWQQTTRAFAHLHSHKDAPVPATSPFVVIGSGISGGLLTHELIQKGVEPRDIIILEAREAASGASSRNAGHVRPDAFRGFGTYSKHHGNEQAVEILSNERLALEAIKSFVNEYKIPCDFHYTTTFDCCMTPEFVEHQKTNFEAFQAAGGDVSHVNYYTGQEASEKTRVANVLAAYEWPAGSSHPAKLAQWLLTDVIERGVKLFTHCPVSSVSSGDAIAGTRSPKWDIHTPRGIVTTSRVIFCTNAFTGLLVPQVADHIVPHRAQAHAIIPVSSLSGNGLMQSTFSVRHSLNHYYSIIQRQSDGTIILGASLSNPELPRAVLEGNRSIDDSGYSEEMKEDALKNFETIFAHAGVEKQVHGEGLSHVWNGIVGLTTDEVPFLGPIEGKPGQFICAGFNGHGMARIFTCAPGVAKLVLGSAWGETNLPECFQFSQARLDKLSYKSALTFACNFSGQVEEMSTRTN